MTKFQMLAAVAAAALATACAGTQTASNETRSSASAATTSSARTAQTTMPSAQTTTPAPAQQAQAMPAPTTPAMPTTYTDAQLQSFARAAIEIDPISRTLSTATPEQQAAAAEQIRQILARNSLDGATYNAIAARAQSDPALAQRIATLNRADQTNG